MDVVFPFPTGGIHGYRRYTWGGSGGGGLRISPDGRLADFRILLLAAAGSTFLVNKLSWFLMAPDMLTGVVLDRFRTPFWTVLDIKIVIVGP